MLYWALVFFGSGNYCRSIGFWRRRDHGGGNGETAVLHFSQIPGHARHGPLWPEAPRLICRFSTVKTNEGC